MIRIGLLSDTHAYWDEKYLEYFEPCDEIWHAGDIGSVEVAERLAAFRPFRAVYGNIDGQAIRKLYPQVNRFTVDDTEVLIKHIGGYPGKYDPSIIGSLTTRRWICCTSIPELRGCQDFIKCVHWCALSSSGGRLRTWKLSSWQINNFSYYFCHLGFLSDLCTQFMNNEDEHEGNYSCRRFRYQTVPINHGNIQTVTANL